MKRKVLSIMLMLVMVLSLAACGKKAGADAQPTVKNVLENISKVEANTVTCEFVIEDAEFNMAFRITGSNQDETHGYATIEMKLNMDPYVMEDYAELTNMYVINEEVYINVQQILDFLTDLDSQFAMLSAYFALPGDYLVVTLDDLIALYEQMGIDISELNLESMQSEEWNEEYTKAMVEVFGNMLDEYAVKAGESAVTITADKATFTVNNDNVVAIMDALAAMDIENYFMDFAEKIDKIDGTVGNTAYMKEQVEGMNEEIKSAAEEVKANGVGDDKVNMVIDMGVNGTSAVINFNMDMETYGETSKMTLTMTTTPDKASDVTVPVSTMTIEELMKLLSDLGLM
ncbi:MAG: hypothetical protein PUF12_03640 [Thermoflexaceae bacterium]|nr:hypothetical protein [Thermoflexaceae bacterium]